jgi:hypothetical protein
MLTFIKNIFYNFNKKKHIEKSLEDNALTILVNSKDPYLHIAITNIDNDQIQNFAKMLYDLNSGLYTTSIINILTQLSYRDKDIAKFLSCVIAEWSFLIESNKNQVAEPLIKPTRFIGGVSKNE